MKEREQIKKVQEAVAARWRGRYAVLARRLGDGWYKEKVARVLRNPNPGAVELVAVCAAAGVPLHALLAAAQTLT